MSKQPCRFDDSLPKMAAILRENCGDEFVERGVFLRDAIGRLRFFIDSTLADEKKAQLSKLVLDEIGAYVAEAGSIADQADYGISDILTDNAIRQILVDGLWLKTLDRRIVGADWNTSPAPSTTTPRFVFSSLKGGVGRSTALTVVAAELASEGKNVLVVDLDLEAPGVGSLLLPEDRMPEFGVLDYLVEANLDLDNFLNLSDCLGISPLTAGAGLVTVMPVVGRSTERNPNNYLGKLGRGMTEAILEDGSTLGISGKVERLLGELESAHNYDTVLLDARAGLAELAAGPLLSLGATILLFGTNQTQTIQDFRFLFAHLGSINSVAEESPWQNLKMVHAKALGPNSVQKFREDAYDLFAEYIYEIQEGVSGFNYDIDDPDAPHYPLPVLMESTFADWDPVMQPDKLQKEYYRRTFDPLLSFVKEVIRKESI